MGTALGDHRLAADLHGLFNPFPSDQFPYAQAAPERELLQPGSQPESADKEMDEETSDVYVTICTET